MDGTQFDIIARTMATTISRRTLGGLLGSALALLGLASPDSGLAANGNCKPACGKCERCQKGKCRQTRRGKRCKKGTCRPKPNGTGCGANRVCQGGTCRPRRCGTGDPCLVFVTSTTHDGSVGGLTGADATCQGLANRANLPGNYKAWLSNSTNTPNSRFTNTGRTGPYVLRNGTVIALSYADLTSGSNRAPIDVNEDGTDESPSFVWTNTKPNGARIGNQHCANWMSGSEGTGYVGANNVKDGAWTFSDPVPCSASYRLYCFQQG